MLVQCASPGEGMCSVARLPSMSLMGRVCVCVLCFSEPGTLDRLITWTGERGGVCGTTGGERGIERPVPVIYRLPGMSHFFFLSVLIPACMQTYFPTTQHTLRCWPMTKFSSASTRTAKLSHRPTAQGVMGSLSVIRITRQSLTHY